MQSVRFFRIISNCTFNPVKAFLAYSQPIDVDWLYKGFASSYPQNAATKELIPVPTRSIRVQRRAVGRSFITRKVGEVLVKLGKSRVMTIFESSSDSETAGSDFTTRFLCILIMCLKLMMVEMMDLQH